MVLENIHDWRWKLTMLVGNKEVVWGKRKKERIGIFQNWQDGWVYIGIYNFSLWAFIIQKVEQVFQKWEKQHERDFIFLHKTSHFLYEGSKRALSTLESMNQWLK
jgi:hypothetical protein